jgi:hypothetical protein
VIASRVGAYGLVLQALGINTFALKTTMTGKHAAAILERPGLRSRFVCSHGCCRFRGFEDLPARRRQHFLWSRDAEVSAIRGRPNGGLRRDYVREQLRDAQETGRIVRRALMELGSEAPTFEHLYDSRGFPKCHLSHNRRTVVD